MIKLSRNKLRLQRKRRISARLKTENNVPRLTVFKSLAGIYAQVIDDSKGTTLVSASAKEAKGKNNLDGAKKVGVLIAKKCLEKKIKAVAFDRSGYKYHGKIKAIADGARSGGLKF
jgi:large subunit ribosomal protein L18